MRRTVCCRKRSITSDGSAGKKVRARESVVLLASSTEKENRARPSVTPRSSRRVSSVKRRIGMLGTRRLSGVRKARTPFMDRDSQTARNAPFDTSKFQTDNEQLTNCIWPLDASGLDGQMLECMKAVEDAETGPVKEESMSNKCRDCDSLPGFVRASYLAGMMETVDGDDATVEKETTTCKFSHEQLELRSWSLPDVILKRYHDLGITHMFDWQAECLLNSRSLQRANLIYSAPTSAGKTLVAELLILKQVLETRRKALFILPFVSVAHEKTQYLRALFQDIGLRVDAFVGSQSPVGGLAGVDVAICTIEKANSLLNRLLEDREMSQLGIIVVDELHMAGDPSRGYLLELLLTKVQFASQGTLGSADQKVQIVGMSATLPNLSVLADWLHADLYCTNYRPVPLTEYVKVGNRIYSKAMKLIRSIPESETLSDDPDHIVWLCQETVNGGHSVLVFCPTKNQTEKLAEKIAANIMRGARGCNLHVNSKQLKQISEQLERTQVGMDCQLANTLPKGVAFHHAGLTTDEREIIERGFRQSVIRVLTATSTLSSGVNLPARRVIIRTPMFHRTTLDPMTYKQMAGRAGRKGVDSCGESILVCKPSEKQKGSSLVQSRLRPVKSCLMSGESTDGHCSAMKRALLEVIASGVAVIPNDVERYTESTLLAAEMKAVGKDTKIVKESVASSLDFLHKNEFISLRNETTTCDFQWEDDSTAVFHPTQLGTACLASALSPDEALIVLSELQRARKSFVLENELHLVYQVTPVFLQKQWPCPNWYTFLSLWDKLSPDLLRVADLVGVKESFLARAVNGKVPERTPEQRAASRVHRRFFTALALHDLIQEVPLHVVAGRYGVSRGLLQSLQASAATFAGMVTVFCQRLSWHNMELLLSQFQSRLCFGIERELCELVTISLLNGQRARSLYNAGYRTLSSIAVASSSEIETILKKLMPFKSTRDEDMDRRHASWVSKLHLGITEAEAAEEIVKEARLRVKDSTINVAHAMTTVTEECRGGNVLTLKNRVRDTQHVDKTSVRVEHGEKTVEQRQNGNAMVMQGDHDGNELVEMGKVGPMALGGVETTNRNDEQIGDRELQENRMESSGMEGSYLLFGGDVSVNVSERVTSLAITCVPAGEENQPSHHYLKGDQPTESDNGTCEQEAIAKTPESPHQACCSRLDSDNVNHQSDLMHGVHFDCDSIVNTPIFKRPDFVSPVMFSSGSRHETGCQAPFAISTPVVGEYECFEASPMNESFIHSYPFTQSVQGEFASPACCMPSDGVVRATPIQSGGSYMMADLSIGTIQLLEAACCEAENKKSSGSERVKGEEAAGPLKRLLFTDTEYQVGQTIPMDETRQIAAEMNDKSNCPNKQALSKGNPSSPQMRGHLETMSPLKKPTFSDVDSEQGQNRPACSETHITETVDTTHRNVSAREAPAVSLMSPTQSDFCIIDVAADREVFQSFLKEWKSQTCFSLSLACYHISDNSVCQTRFRKSSKQTNPQSTGIAIPNSSEGIAGVAVCWRAKDAYFLSLAPCMEPATHSNGGELESSLCEASVAGNLSQGMRLNALRDVLEGCEQLSVCVMFDVKEQIKKLFPTCRLSSLRGLHQDPKVADWLLGPDEKEKNFHRMLMHYLPDEINPKKDGIGFLATNAGPPRIKACAEAVLSLMLADCLRPMLETGGLWKPFTETEMPSLVSLAKMEMNGIGFSIDECERQKSILLERMLTLEQEAYQLAGHMFSLTNPDDVSKVLFHELGIPPPSDCDGSVKTTGKRKRGRKLVQFSTAKDVLEKLRRNHRLPGVILEWRRINNAITKTLYPIQKDRQFNARLGTDRIHAVCQTHTATGRVAVCDPNLQNVPKEFDIGTTVTMTTSPCSVRVVSHLGKIHRLPSPLKTITTTSICMRNCFTASAGALLLAADYSQLELRLIAHLSQDRRLKEVLNSGGDVFKMIASQWLSVEVDQVSAKQRQQAKQICYGMIYGIGAKALAEQLRVSEGDALQFMDSFKSRYSGLKSYLRETVTKCQQCGYVETLLGRKRYLSAIHSTQPHARNHAERQAVNTTIQGSAADLVKMAMVNVDRKLLKKYPPRDDGKRHGGMLVLQIHDELLYDVVEEDLLSVAEIVQQELEHAVNLLVSLPVKLQVGVAWGSLEPLQLDSD